MNKVRNLSCCFFDRVDRCLLVLIVCAVAAFANAANPDDQIYDESPDGRYGFRDSFAAGVRTSQPEEDAPSGIEVVEISSKRVVLQTPKEALTPIHLRRQPQAWSRDSNHIALSYQTEPRTWTTTLYGWNGKEFAEVSWPRDAVRRQIEEEHAAQLKALGLPESAPRKFLYEGFTALEWVDATAVKIIAERIDSVVLSKNEPPAELDARFSFVVNVRDPQKAEIADVTKIPGTAGYGDLENMVEARLTDERPESFYLVKDVEEGQQPFRLYALERFTVVGEKGNDYLVQDGCNHKGRISRRLVHKFPSAFSSDEMDSCAKSKGAYYNVLVKAAKSGSLPALRAFFAFREFDGGAAEAYQSSIYEVEKVVTARQISEATASFASDANDPVKSSKSSPAIRRSKRTDFSQVLGKANSCGRLADEGPGGSFLVTRVPKGQKPFKIYGGELFAITGEQDGDYLIQDVVGNHGHVAKDFVERMPKPTSESAMLLPLMGLHYLRLAKGAQTGDDSADATRLMLSLDITGQSGAEHAKNLEAMLNREDARSILLKEFSPARVRAVGAMLLQGRSENEKAELTKKYPQIFPGDATSATPVKKKS